MTHAKPAYPIVFYKPTRQACRLYPSTMQLHPVTPAHELIDGAPTYSASRSTVAHYNADYVWWHPGQQHLQTNVPWLLRHHSPTGMNAGYGGSGPADFALNIAEWRLRQTGYDGAATIKLWDGNRCFDLAYRVHQDLKWQFIAMSKAGALLFQQLDTFFARHRDGSNNV